MNQDFFREIGECLPHHKENENTISTDKIYEAVTNKINKRRKRKKSYFRLVGGLAATAAIFGLTFLLWNLHPGFSGQNDKSHKIILYALAAKDAELQANPGQEEEPEKIEVTEDEVVLGEFNSMLSNSVGFPVMFMVSGEDAPSDAKVSVQITEGRLLRWDRYVGTVEELGQKGEFECGEEIYWSPPSETKEIENAVIEASLYIGGKKEDTVKARLTHNEFVYSLIKIGKGGDAEPTS